MITMLALLIPHSLEEAGKILVFLIMLSVLVVLHEGGHFLLARRNGVRVNDFAVGFGPTLLKWTSLRSGTNYRINLFPIGGYCAMQGEDGKSTEAEQQRSFREHTSGGVAAAASDEAGNFQAKSPRQRLAIVLAGPIANFILTFAILLASALLFGAVSDQATNVVGPLKANSPGVRAGLHALDRIVALDGVPVTSGKAMIAKIHASANRPLLVRFERGRETHEITVTPEPQLIDGKMMGRIGFVPIVAYERVGALQAFGDAWTETGMIFVQNLTGLTSLVIHPQIALQNVRGPIGMEQAASQLQDLGWGPYLHLAAAISMALGIFNLLPIPALDGGRAIFIVAEMLRGKPIAPEREAFVHVTGFALLMVLMLFVAFHDVANIFAGKSGIL